MEYFSAVGILIFAVLTDAADIEDGCNCPLIYSPVCGTDQNDYDNECLLKCAAAKKNSGLQISFHGACNSNEQESDHGHRSSKHRKTKSCSCRVDLAEPVCDSNGKTHISSCHFKCRRTNGVRIVRDGAC